MERVFEDIRVFDTETVLQDMVDAKEGTVFILGEKHIRHPVGDDTVEMTFVQIQKVRDNRGFHGLENRAQAIAQKTPKRSDSKGKGKEK